VSDVNDDTFGQGEVGQTTTGVLGGDCEVQEARTTAHEIRAQAR
jgi:hypothetical protein